MTTDRIRLAAAALLGLAVLLAPTGQGRSQEAQPGSQSEEASPWWKPPDLNAPEPPPVEDETTRALQERLVAALAVEAALVQEAQALLKTAPDTPVPPPCR